MREETEFRPKPMTEIGSKPVLWHIMKIFSLHGHNEFVICAGYKGQIIKEYFANYAMYSRDFTTKLGASDATVFHGEHDEAEWEVTVADTGLDTQTGGRLARVRKYLDDSTFLCTYGDGIAPVQITDLVAHHRTVGKSATMTVTKPTTRFGVVEVSQTSVVTRFLEKPVSRDFVNMGFFVFGPEIFEGLADETVLEEAPLQRLAEREDLAAFQHDGFWKPMDTYREFQELNSLWDKGLAPWKVWE